ncbi:MAG TPA: GAF domain-containing sensor histidine kinase [Trueperaceae bacterium]
MRVGSRQEQLEVLNTLGEVLNREPEFERALPEALERLVRLMGLSTGWVFLSNTSQGDSHQGSFSLAASTGLPPALERDDREPLCSGSCDCQGLLRRGKLDRGVNMVTCSRLAKARGDRGGLELHASVPLLGAQGPVGIVNLAAPGDTRFEASTLTFLAAVGKQLGIAFERSRLQARRTREARYTATLEERERIARQMHDSLAQLLFAADLSLQAALDEQGEDPSPSLVRAAEAVAGALADLRGLVEVQRPADLSSGLLPALSRLAERTGGGSVRVHLDSQPLDAFGRAAETLYLVAQEAVGNALRHGECTNIWLRLEAVEDRLRLTVADDGKGFDPHRAAGGLGLQGMHDRTKGAGGSFAIESGQDGSRVVAEVPWRTD